MSLICAYLGYIFWALVRLKMRFVIKAITLAATSFENLKQLKRSVFCFHSNEEVKHMITKISETRIPSIIFYFS